MTDFLDEDIVKVGGQQFAAISLVSRTTNQKVESDKIALKIRGVFATKEEAEAHIRRLIKTDPEFDIFVVDMYKWLLLPPNLDEIENHEYQEPFLNDLIKGHKESQLLAKQQFEERKRLIMEKNLDAALSKEERLPPPEEQELPRPESYMPTSEASTSTQSPRNT
jgi:hypothetical protein